SQKKNIFLFGGSCFSDNLYSVIITKDVYLKVFSDVQKRNLVALFLAVVPAEQKLMQLRCLFELSSRLEPNSGILSYRLIYVINEREANI
ncbi:MAG: hypothetical protein O7D30_04145, partial [Rickettsia endosymbiont of Ixodes persulcatus]|nr:hypothetical protein [Rickettsia endosymbiont of Ixodes persulcatus]